LTEEELLSDARKCLARKESLLIHPR
jgi:hypothetical protein